MEEVCPTGSAPNLVGALLLFSREEIWHECPMCGAQRGRPCYLACYDVAGARHEIVVAWYHAPRRRLVDVRWAERSAA